VSETLSANPAWRVVSGKSALEPHWREGAHADALFGSDGFFRTFPPESQTDGFFAAVLERSAAQPD